MAKRKNSGAFDDLEDSFFAAGEDGAFSWGEDDEEPGVLAEDALAAKEAERAAREEAERRAREEAERRAREEAERRAREEAERRAREEAERRAREEAERAAASDPTDDLAESWFVDEDEWQTGDDSFREPEVYLPSEAARGAARSQPEGAATGALDEEPEVLIEEPSSEEIAGDEGVDELPHPRISIPTPQPVEGVLEEDVVDEDSLDGFQLPPAAPAAIVLPISPDGEITEDPTDDPDHEAYVTADPTPNLAPSTAATALDTVVPSGPASASDEAASAHWRELIRLLESEGAGSAGALLEAARLARTRLGDLDEAARLLELAEAAEGQPTAPILRERVLIQGGRRELRALVETYEALAGISDGAAAAEYLQDAALVALNHLRDRALALRLLEAAIAADPEAYLSLTLLADLLREEERWEQLVDVLGRLAALSEGGRAAELQLERGAVLEHHLEHREAALEAYRSAQRADPDSAPVFLALERVLTDSAEWTGLAELYAAEADRTAGADRAFWRFQVATVYRSRLFDVERASEAYKQALSEGAGPEVAHAYQAFLAENERWEELAEALEQESTQVEVSQQPHVLFRLARLKEQQLRDVDGALAIYRRVARDPAAAPAAEAVAQILQEKQDWTALLSFWEERIKLLDEPNLQVTLEYRMGEICEGPLDDQEGARKHFEKILDIAPGYLPALEGLERVYTRLEAWEQLAAVYEQRAILAEDADAVALQLHRAAAVCDFRMGDIQRAREFYKRALDHVPHFPASLDAYVRILEREGDWVGLARALRSAAASSPDSNQVVSLYYRAGRVFHDKADDREAAMDCLRRCLALSPGFLPARLLLKELNRSRGAWSELLELQLGDAASTDDLDRKAWLMLAAAAVAEHVEERDPEALTRQILEFDPAHPGAMALLETRLLQRGDRVGLVELYRQAAGEMIDDDGRARLAAVLAVLLKDAGDNMGAVQAAGEVVIADEAEGRPLRAIARICEGLGYWEVAQQALDAVGDRVGVARIQERHLESPEEALSTYSLVLEDSPDSVAAVSAIQRLSQASGDRESLASAHARLAELSGAPPVQRVHAILAGHLMEAGAGEPAAAAALYRRAFDLRPTRGKAFDSLRHLYIAAGDVEGLKAIHAAVDDPSAVLLASDLLDVGAAEEAVEALAGAGDDLVTLVWRERALSEAGRWKEAFEVLRALAEKLSDPEQRQRVAARQRWMLAEKLAETDEAWDFYRRLHEDDPDDPEVLEALAGIAAARGDEALGIQYLEGLARVSRDVEDSARYQRRIARIQEGRGELEAARQSYLKALNYQPEDTESLAGLHRIAEASEDWKALAGVLAREASLADGARQIQLYAQIARVWEDRIADPAVAADCWRKVLEHSPKNIEAMERLCRLTEATEDWSGFVDVAEGLAAVSEGKERVSLLRRIGMTYMEHLHREEEAIKYLGLAAAGEEPDLEAARALERLHTARGEYEQAVEAQRLQARAMDGEAAVETLLRAARLYRDSLHDRQQAAAIYGEVLERQPDNSEALTFLADHRFRARDYEGAIELFERMEAGVGERDIDDFDVQLEVSLFFYHFAQALNTVGRSEDALARLEKALSLNPNHIPSLEAVGPLYMAQEAWGKAERVYRQLVALIGGTAQAEQLATIYSHLGTVEHALGKLDKAKKRFNKALELQPNNVTALQGMAGVLRAQEDWNTLLNVYNNIIYYAQSREDVVDAYLTKGMILDTRMKLPDKATQHYRKALAFGPGQHAALARLSELSIRERMWEEALGFVNKALALDLGASSRATLLLARAICTAGRGDESTAQAALEEARGLDEELAAASDGLGSGSLDALRKLLRERVLAMGV